MKKLYGILLLVLVLTISLVGCNSTSKDLDEAQVLEVVEKYCEVDYLTQSLVCDSEGVTDVRVLQVINAFEDTTKYPSYMLDTNGDYVQMKQLGELLKMKYFNDAYNESDVYYKRGGETYFRFYMEGEKDEDVIFAKLVLLIQELENYDYYYLSSSDVKVRVLWFDSGYYRYVELVTSKDNLLSDTLDYTPDSFFDNYLEMEYKFELVSLNQANILTIYNDYVTQGTYDGFVLNYTVA